MVLGKLVCDILEIPMTITKKTLEGISDAADKERLITEESIKQKLQETITVLVPKRNLFKYFQLIDFVTRPLPMCTLKQSVKRACLKSHLLHPLPHCL